MKTLITLLIVVISVTVLANSQSLSELVQKQAKEIKSLKAEIAALKKGANDKASKLLVKVKKLSKADRRKVASLKNKIKILNYKIEDYRRKAKNTEHMIVQFNKADRKGWRYKTESPARLRPLSTLKKHWSRKRIKMIYISKSQKKEKIKKSFLKVANDSMVKKTALEKELQKLVNVANFG